jgi:hypothetical protein
VATTWSFKISAQSPKLLLLVDHQARPLIAAHQESEEETGLLAGEGQITQLIEDEDPRVDQLLQRALQAVLLASPEQPAHEAFQGEEQHRVAGLHGLDPEGDGQVGLAHAGRAEQDDVLGPLHEAQARQLSDDLAVDRRLEVEVELLQGLDPGKPGEFEATLDPPLIATPPLGLQVLGQEALVVEIPLGRLFADPVKLGLEVVHPQALEECGQFHVAASS